MQLINPHRCRMCDAELLPDDDFCTQCGLQGRRSATDPVDVRTKDVLLSVIMALVALAVTTLVNWPALERFYTWGWSSSRANDLLDIGVWNGWILGIPVVLIVRGWYLRVRRGEFNHAWIWRDYWFVELMVLSPFILVPLVRGIIWVLGNIMIALLR